MSSHCNTLYNIHDFENYFIVTLFHFGAGACGQWHTEKDSFCGTKRFLRETSPENWSDHVLYGY